MNSELVEIDIATLRITLANDPSLSTLLDYADRFERILEGRLDGQPIAVIILTPIPGYIDSVYAWVHTTEFGRKHKVAIARLFKRNIGWAQSKYKRFYAHCKSNQQNDAWIRFTQAKIDYTNADIVQFVIGDNHG